MGWENRLWGGGRLGEDWDVGEGVMEGQDFQGDAEEW